MHKQQHNLKHSKTDMHATQQTNARKKPKQKGLQWQQRKKYATKDYRGRKTVITKQTRNVQKTKVVSKQKQVKQHNKETCSGDSKKESKKQKGNTKWQQEKNT